MRIILQRTFIRIATMKTFILALVSVLAGAVNAQENACIICTNDFTQCELNDYAHGDCIRSPDDEGVFNAIDGDTNSKYLLQCDQITNTNTGIQVTPTSMAEDFTSSIISIISLTTANDFPARDPKSWKISGSNDGVSFSEIAQGDFEVCEDRHKTQTVTFENTESFLTYRVIFPTIVGHDGYIEPSMQVAEVGLLNSNGVNILSPTDTIFSVFTAGCISTPAPTAETNPNPSTAPPVVVTDIPTDFPLVAMTPAPTIAPTEETTSVSPTSETVDFKTCIICPNGATAGKDYYQPNAESGDFRTCAELIDAAGKFESGTDACGWAEFNDEYYCCYTAPEDPCNICPDGATVAGGDDYVPEYEGNSATCSDLIEEAKLYESGSFSCGVYDIDKEKCCPPVTTTPPTSVPEESVATPLSESPGGNNITVLVAAISAGVIISFMALAIYYLRKVASYVKGSPGTNSERVVHMPEGGIQTVVATKMLDLETAESSLLRASTAPPPYAPHASAPPLA